MSQQPYKLETLPMQIIISCSFSKSAVFYNFMFLSEYSDPQRTFGCPQIDAEK